MKNCKLSDFYDDVLMSVDADLAEKYKKGIINNFISYVQRESHSKLLFENNTIFVEENFIDKQYIKDYFKKTKDDLSAKDCAKLALTGAHIPPLEEMSIESITKAILENIKKSPQNAYIKKVHGNINTICVDYATAQDFILNSDIQLLIRKQIEKAEEKNKQNNSTEWIDYLLRNSEIASYEDLDYKDNEVDNPPKRLTKDEKMYLMIKALFDKNFSEFDYQKYEDYLNEMEFLHDNFDFGERFQYLQSIFHSQFYKNEFYHELDHNGLIDALADKVAEKILEKMENNKKQ